MTLTTLKINPVQFEQSMPTEKSVLASLFALATGLQDTQATLRTHSLTAQEKEEALATEHRKEVRRLEDQLSKAQLRPL